MIRLACTVLAVAGVLAPAASYAQGTCVELKSAPELTEYQIYRAGVSDKLRTFSDALSSLRTEFGSNGVSVMIVVVDCTLPQPEPRKRFDATPTEPESWVVYVSPDYLKRYSPN